MLPVKWVFALVIMFILALGGGSTALYFYRDLQSFKALAFTRTEELREANLAIGRAGIKIGDASKLISQLQEDLKKEINERKAVVTMYGILEARYKATMSGQGRTRVVYKDRYVDLPPHKLFTRKDTGDYEEVISLQTHYEDFRISIVADAIKNHVEYTLHQKFTGQLIETQLPSGENNYYFKLNEVNGKGQSVGALTLDKFEIIKTAKPEKKMFWWAPHLDITAGAGVGIDPQASFKWTAGPGFSTSGYGRTKNDLTWKFARFGLEFAGPDGLSVSFTPAQYNIGEHIPLISNMYLGIYGGYDVVNKNPHIGVSVGAVL